MVVQSEGVYYVIARPPATRPRPAARPPLRARPRNRSAPPTACCSTRVRLEAERRTPSRSPRSGCNLFPEGGVAQRDSFASRGSASSSTIPGFPGQGRVGDYVVDDSGEEGVCPDPGRRRAAGDWFALAGLRDTARSRRKVDKPPRRLDIELASDLAAPSRVLHRRALARRAAHRGPRPGLRPARRPDPATYPRVTGWPSRPAAPPWPTRRSPPVQKSVVIDPRVTVPSSARRLGRGDRARRAFVIDPRGRSYALIGGPTPSPSSATTPPTSR